MQQQRWIAVVAGALALAACSETKDHRASERREETAEKGRDKEEHETELDARDVAGEQSVLLVDAIAAARAANPGEALEAGLEGDVVDGRRDVFIEVMILDASGNAVEVKVDPGTGRVRSSSKEGEADETAELVALSKRLPAGHIGLGDLARHAKTSGDGKLVAAAFKAKKDGTIVAVLEYLVGTREREVTLDVKTGAVLTSKTSEGDEEDEDEDEDEEHEGPQKK